MSKVEYNKLIRDKILEISNEKGTVCEWRSLKSQEFRAELLKKLTEEAVEVKGAGSSDNLIEELADVAEVILAIQKEFDISSEQIEKVRVKKRTERGGFDGKVFLISATYKD